MSNIGQSNDFKYSIKYTFLNSGGCVTLRMNLQLKEQNEVITFPGQLLMHHLLIPSKR